MASVFDVASYILQKQGPMTAMKLQKLVYYTQAWSLVWDEKPLFPEKIRAWVNGPVVPELFAAHQGEFTVSKVPKGNPTVFDVDEQATIDGVLAHYGSKTAPWLIALTHREQPWLDARKGLADSERGNKEITLGAMADYYGNL